MAALLRLGRAVPRAAVVFNTRAPVAAISARSMSSNKKDTPPPKDLDEDELVDLLTIGGSEAVPAADETEPPTPQDKSTSNKNAPAPAKGKAKGAARPPRNTPSSTAGSAPDTSAVDANDLLKALLAQDEEGRTSAGASTEADANLDVLLEQARMRGKHGHASGSARSADSGNWFGAEDMEAQREAGRAQLKLSRAEVEAIVSQYKGYDTKAEVKADPAGDVFASPDLQLDLPTQLPEATFSTRSPSRGRPFPGGGDNDDARFNRRLEHPDLSPEERMKAHGSVPAETTATLETASPQVRYFDSLIATAFQQNPDLRADIKSKLRSDIANELAAAQQSRS